MNVKVKSELKKISGKYNGLLRPRDIVNFARNTKTALHKCFEWDNKKAGEEYRKEQARRLIRVYVVEYKHPHRTAKPIRAIVSLPMDRRKSGGGYRYLENVMSDKEFKAELLKSALDDLETFKQRYQTLRELAGIFKAIDHVAEEIELKLKRVG
jgi:hypothetical protein